MTFEKVMMNAESIAGSTKGNVILVRIVFLFAPMICPISSSSELTDRSDAETRR
ncbi:hypothetical protein SDC9_146946 [bioreactor metagenome]|uniref:Uncharacterized protein n=1 Tax=bioreactor metagenome TaxID=1076179 RepID=A0A645EGM8_9ZZZZ